MADQMVNVRRLNVRLTGDPRRTITRFFWPGAERAARIIERVRHLPELRISELLNENLRQFEPVNPGLEDILMDNADRATEQADIQPVKEFETKMLIGAYFSMEYAFESAALFNPSMVAAPDQPGLQEGQLRFLMSLRAIGEGHISSITFRRGTIDAEGNISINAPTLKVHALNREKNRRFRKTEFTLDVTDTLGKHPLADEIFTTLADNFSLLMLEQRIEYCEHKCRDKEEFDRVANIIRFIAQSEYQVNHYASYAPEDIVLFPISEAEAAGMEDMRLVRLVEDDGSLKYYGTYTAFNGREIIPQLLEIASREHSYVHIMRGKFARNKGMAIFPRRVAGRYAMIGRIDGENLFLLQSDRIDRWDEARLIAEPQHDWEFVQIGNCGSPLWTDAGWLLLTHGVGPMRKYCIGAMLLDAQDPSKVLGRLPGPLMTPTEEERAGYVPNVVYSCGALIHQDMLVIPYGISDSATGFAIVNLDELLSKLT